MTKIKLLEEQIEMAYHNLMCYSKNYSMTVPKDNCKEEWKEAKEKCALWEEIKAELEGKKFNADEGPFVSDGKMIYKWKEVLEAAKKVAETKGVI